MTDNIETRRFYDKRHAEGAWNTHTPVSGKLLRWLLNFLSFKRSGVSELASRCSDNCIGLDLGCGKGAYADWFLNASKGKILAVDWSYVALNEMAPNPDKNIIRVCASACNLPFKSRCFDFFYTIDVLGHLDNPEKALDEVLRVTKQGSPFFIHSECSDYKTRWPDRKLIAAMKRDLPAEEDGHTGITLSSVIYKSLIARFTVESFFSPAGLAGWLTGYPEKYHRAFKAASWKFLSALTYAFALLKRAPFSGVLLRFINALTNRAELFFGIVGGGSCFATGTVLQADNSEQTESSEQN